MSLLTTTAVVTAALGCAVVGGIFFAFSNFIMKALARLSSAEGMAAMQSINVTVLNKWFLGVFTGTAALSLPLAGYAIANWSTPPAPTWQHYLKRWTTLNSQRSLGSMVAALLFIVSLMLGLETDLS